ncbi:hypothetical protein AB0D10_05090 [Kitasatospora sp. NPDC048545]|uniref:hypothetical protein n=1 Tax=Kitasatospora sp. NPDC048545 TaxID=3157208 RepID=UPI0033C6DCDD
MARRRPNLGSGGASGTAGVLRFWNRTITIMRGTAINGYGDATDVGVPLYTGVPAALAETEQVAFDSASQRQQIIRSITCTVPNWADVRTTDTIRDETTGRYFMIENISERPGIGYYPPPKTLTLRARSGVTAGSD